MIGSGDLNSRVAKDLLKEVVFEDADPKKLATQRGLLQQNSEADLLPLITQIIADNAVVATEYKAGKDSAIQFFNWTSYETNQRGCKSGCLEVFVEKELLN